MNKKPNELDSIGAYAVAQTLRECNEVFSLFIDHAPASIAMFDREMHYLAVSKRWKEDFFLGDRDIIGVSHYEIFPDIPARWKDIHRQGIAGEVISEDEDRFERLDGMVQWLRWEVQPWRYLDGAIGGIIIFTEEITRYKNVEEEVRGLNAVLEQRVEERTAQLTAEIEVRKFSQQALRQYEVIIESSHDAMMIIDASSNITKVNRSFTHVTGYSQEEVLGKNPRMISSGKHDKVFFEKMFQTVSTEGSWEGEIWDKRKNGEIYPCFMTVTAIKDAENKVAQFVGIFHDITERKLSEEILIKAEQRFRFMLENSPMAVRIASKATGKVLYANQNYGKLIGLPLEQAIGINPQQFYVNQQEYSDVVRQLGKGENVINKLFKLDNKKEVKWGLASFMVTDFENEPAYLGWIYDISDRKRLEDQAEYLAFHDTLTGLPNRRMLNDRLQQAMSASKRSGKYGAVMFMDLDKFKSLNDTHGHVAGDLLLLEVGRRIKGCLRETDTAARFGGDEFVVMLTELDKDKAVSEIQAAIVGKKIRAALSEPYVFTITHDGQADTMVEHRCTGSVGVTMFVDHDFGQDDIMKRADAAMFEAKKAGRNQIRFYGENG